MRVGFAWFYWVSLDEGAYDADGDGPYFGGEFEERFLEPID